MIPIEMKEAKIEIDHIEEGNQTYMLRRVNAL